MTKDWGKYRAEVRTVFLTQEFQKAMVISVFLYDFDIDSRRKSLVFLLSPSQEN